MICEQTKSFKGIRTTKSQKSQAPFSFLHETDTMLECFRVGYNTMNVYCVLMCTFKDTFVLVNLSPHCKYRCTVGDLVHMTYFMTCPVCEDKAG